MSSANLSDLVEELVALIYTAIGDRWGSCITTAASTAIESDDDGSSSRSSGSKTTIAICNDRETGDSIARGDYSTYIRCLDAAFTSALLSDESWFMSNRSGQMSCHYFEQLVTNQIACALRCFGADITPDIVDCMRRISISLIQPKGSSVPIADMMVSSHKFLFFCNLFRVTSTRLAPKQELSASKTVDTVAMLKDIAFL